MPKKRLVVAGIVGRYPVGGVTWCALHYIAGFQALGYDVFYLEDTGECGFDPVNELEFDQSRICRCLHQATPASGRTAGCLDLRPRAANDRRPAKQAGG
jgi:hypothetical protein